MLFRGEVSFDLSSASRSLVRSQYEAPYDLEPATDAQNCLIVFARSTIARKAKGFAASKPIVVRIYGIWTKNLPMLCPAANTEVVWQRLATNNAANTEAVWETLA